MRGAKRLLILGKLGDSDVGAGQRSAPRTSRLTSH
jgi:hypothetical protein